MNRVLRALVILAVLFIIFIGITARPVRAADEPSSFGECDYGCCPPPM